ncbi:hypothetical protein A4S06_01415 [Erysipelotrichaceae bacterium MTC7]|nr:hypothetical protein A4S06_01415 [Erysipelotrichaceae bacterium MTC7]
MIKSLHKKVFCLFMCTLMLLSMLQPTNYTLLAPETNDETNEQVPAGTFDNEIVGETLQDFDAIHGGVEQSDEHLILSNSGGDNFAMYSSEQTYKSFIYQADIELLEGRSAALLIGVENKENPSSQVWYGANFDVEENENCARLFRVNGDHPGNVFAVAKDDTNVDFSQKLRLTIEIMEDGQFVYQLKNTDVEDSGFTRSGYVDGWTGGSIGLLTFCSKAKFSNITLLDTSINNTQDLLHTNAGSITTTSGAFAIDNNGLHSNNEGDSFALMETAYEDFVYTTDVKFNERKNSCASIVFRASDDLNQKNMYVANLNGETGEVRLFKFQNNAALDLVDSQTISLTDSNEYHFKVTAIGKHFVFHVNGELALNSADYTMGGIKGQNDAFYAGYVGVLTWNGNVSYQNINVSPLTDENNPQLNALTLNQTKLNENVVKDFVFQEDQYIYIGYVKHTASSIDVTASLKSEHTKLVITNEANEEVNLDNLPLHVGKNIYTITAKNGTATVVYRMLIHRMQPEETLYNEDYRGQYHYSVQDGWANDPNGMVYYNGTYHLFYQFYNDTVWGPMHWAHATSTDLIHWEEQPIEFYPDEYGTMFSGCAVVDANNDSGLFEGNEGGIVALITTDGNGQRIIGAYSQDGVNWKKTDNVLIDWTEDALQSDAFRDPKVFRYENKWFMVIAGGPLRIYSSDNLLDWKVESTYANLHTECPDLYPLEVYENGQKTNEIKWVLDRGGRQYKIGDFKEVDGHWSFVPDSAYASNDHNGMGGIENDGIMNFGKDSYAAMTYYIDDFGTSANLNPQRIIAINWMNTWDDYCNKVADISGVDTFNGTFNLQLELSVVKDKNGRYALKQTPIKEYEDLRDEALSLTNETIANENQLLSDFVGDSYEIVANVRPNVETKEVGFKVRVGEDEETIVFYNFETQTVGINRANSGLIPPNSNVFTNVDQQYVTTIEDGSVDLHIFVDRASVEVFTKNDTVTGANQIFANPLSLGLEVYSIGEAPKADITIYNLASIWTNKVNTTDPVSVGVSKASQTLYVGESFELRSWVSPVTASQDVIYEYDDTYLEMNEIAANKKTFVAKQTGQTTITVRSANNPEVKKECVVQIFEDNFKTNLTNYSSVSGNWYVDGELMIGSSNDNAFTFAKERIAGDFTYEFDLVYTEGIVNAIFASQDTNVWNGCYALQIREQQLRLFDFKNDKTIATATTNDNRNRTLHFAIQRTGNILTVFADDTQVLEVDVEQSDVPLYTGGLFGLGIYNTTAKFANVFVSTSSMATAIVEDIQPVYLIENSTIEQMLQLLPESVSVIGEDGIIKQQKESITWDVASVDLTTPSTYTIVGTSSSNLTIEVRVEITVNIEVLKEALKSVLDKANSLDINDYDAIEFTWFTFEVDAAQAVYDNTEATAQEIQDATLQLQTAMDQLVKKSPVEVDKTLLQQALAYVRMYIENGTVDTLIDQAKRTINEAYENGLTIFENEQATQAEVDAAYQEIIRATAYLNFVNGDTTNLTRLYENMLLVDTTLYYATGVDAFNSILQEVGVLLDTPGGLLVAEVEQATDQLMNAYRAMIRKADKSLLETLIGIAKGKQAQETYYESASYESLMSELALAIVVYDDSEASAQEIQERIDGLNQALLALRLKVDRAYLSAQIALIKKMDMTLYTGNSVLVFMDNVREIEAFLLTPDQGMEIEKEVLLSYAMQLQDAKDKLELKEPKPNTPDANDNMKDKPSNLDKLPALDSHSKKQAGVATADTTNARAFLLLCIAGGIIILRRVKRKKI